MFKVIYPASKNMKKLLFITCLFFATTATAQFDTYFYNKTLRMDYFHCGDYNSEQFFFDELLEEPYWGGSKTQLIDNAFYGNYYLNVYDATTHKLIYSRGFCSLFGEWKTVDEAKTTRRCCTETVVFPFPKNNVIVELMVRNKKGAFEKAYEQTIDVHSQHIKKDRRLAFHSFDVVYSGNPATKVDVVLLPDGYTADEMDKFKKDCEVFANTLFSYSPYKEHKSDFNIRAIIAPSAESGADVPSENVWRNTNLNASFSTFDTERYIMTYDNKSVRDMAANVPYDLIYIISNSKKYGGGAIYNHYALSTAGNEKTTKVYAHEFGHLLLGLGDEYVGGAAYNDMYPLDVEPWEANLTTLVNFDKKWKNKIEKNTPVPTSIDSKNPNKLGAYEGGGYLEKGIYRPLPNCMMNSIHVCDEFCPVCKEAIEKQIGAYTK